MGNRDRIVLQENKTTSVKAPKLEEAWSVLGAEGSQHREQIVAEPESGTRKLERELPVLQRSIGQSKEFNFI